MQHLFATSFAGLDKPPALMLRRLRRRQEALVGKPAHRLFLAVYPDAATAARIAQTAHHLRISHGLVAKPASPEQFHISLGSVDRGFEVGVPGIETVKERISSLVMPSFRVGLDRAESFRNGALVLRSHDGVVGLEVLQQRLSDALDDTPRKARPFTPHVTLLHDGYRVPEQRIEPIEWTVRELVLVQRAVRHPGQRQVARWKLTDA